MSNVTRRQRLIGISLSAALVGLIDTIYLTVTHFTNTSVTCDLIDGCNLVLASSWASVFGIPLAALGVVYYGLLVGLLFSFYITEKTSLFWALLALVTVGLVISLGLLYLQIFVLAAVCQYCLLSLVTTLIIFISVLVLARQMDRTSS